MRPAVIVATTIYSVGVVDQIHGKSVHAELTMASDSIEMIELPAWLFPCEIEEGDKFYFTKAPDAIEIRCGNPQK